MNKKARVLIGALGFAIVLISIGAVFYKLEYRDIGDDSGVLTVNAGSLKTYTFKDGRSIGFLYETSNGVVKSPLEMLVGFKGPWPDDSTLSIRLIGPEKELYNSDISIPPSGNDQETEEFTKIYATFHNNVGGKGSFILEKSIVSNGIKSSDAIIIPVEF